LNSCLHNTTIDTFTTPDPVTFYLFYRASLLIPLYEENIILSIGNRSEQKPYYVNKYAKRGFH